MKEGGQKKNILAKTLQKCRSLGHRRQPAASGSRGAGSSASASASPRAADGRAGWAVPAGYFAVMVGPEKERFAVRARCANHPLFRALLDEAETEYGFADCVGPLELPCAVDDFMEVMWEIEQAGGVASPRCSRFAGWGHHHHQQYHGYHMLSPGTFLVAGLW
ncbi:auxin-responsive protein SAUR32-like [Hordeum vulgare subsp. vulgare]|uniref:Auxin-responsive protein n=1 Tax=Hordeum vulgare subsp. vulgare TaxID=112509 RepID=A0A8I6YDE1_HORVV|nr:auxin-responsive protein SAUR32-like [Hordeum vulgare subsp. vulgare]